MRLLDNLRFTAKNLPVSILLLAILLSGFVKEGLAQGPIIGATFPYHQSFDQRTIVVSMGGGALSGSTRASDFTVRVNGVAVPTTVAGAGVAFGYFGQLNASSGYSTAANVPIPAVLPVFNSIFVRFDASSIPGHPAFLLPGETLTVRFNNAGSSLLAGGVPANANNNIDIVSKNTHNPVIADILFQSEGVQTSLDQCSPVNTNFWRWTYTYSLRYRNSTNWNTNANLLRVTWGSGASTSDLQGYLSNTGGDPSTTQPPLALFTYGGFPNSPGVPVSFRTGLNIVQANLGNTVVDGTNAFSYPDNTGVCNFRTTHFPIRIVAPLYSASGDALLQRNTQFNSFDYDDQNTGTVALTPTIPPVTPTSALVCEGTNVGVRFRDISVFNCIGDGTVLPTPAQGAAATPLNNNQRWVRFIYGGAPAASLIPDIRVGVTQVTTNTPIAALVAGLSPNPVLVTSNSSIVDFSPNATPMQNGFVVTGGGGPGTPDGNGVIELNVPANATTSGLISELITTQSAVNQVTGQQFYVTIQYWGVCNPYPSSAPVEVSTSFVQIITTPPAITFTPNPPNFCENQADANYLLTQSGGATGVYNWSSVFPRLVAGDLEKTGTTFNPRTEASVPGVVSKTPASTTTTNFFITQTAGNGCESLPTLVPFKIIKNVTGGTITHPGPNPICSGDTPAVFANSVLPTGGDGAGTYTYQWKVSTTSGGPYVNAVGVGATTAGPFTPSAAITQTSFYVREATSGTRAGTGTCTVALSNEIQITVHTTPTSGTVTGDQTICESPGDPVAFIQTIAPTGGSGVYTYQWESATAIGGPYANISGATGVTYNPPAGLLVTTFFRRVVTSGVCTVNTATSTPPITVTVNNLVNAGTIGTVQSICAGQTPVGLTGTPATGGNGSTYTYQWEVSTTGPAGVYSNAPGASTSQNYSPPALTATPQHYNYRRRATSGLCSSTFSNIVQITVNPLPTANVSGGGAVCGGNPAPDIVFTFTGTGPFNLVYAINGTSQPAQNNITSPFTISNPSVGNYTIVSISDNNSPSCTVNAPSVNITGSAAVTTSLTPPPAVDAFTASSAVCDNGGATSPPQASLDLFPNSVQTYNIGYKFRNLNTLVETIVAPANFTSDASGVVIISPTYAQMGNAPEPLGYQIIVTSIFNTVTLCAGAVPINGPTLVVNPRPAAPTGAVANIACSSGGGVPLTVTAPAAADEEIKWSTGGPALALFVAAAPGLGLESGVKNSSFTPTSSVTATFYAFRRNTTTGCFSNTGIAVTQTQDVQPASAVAGANQPTLCGPSTTLAATAATSSGTGAWTAPGAIAYQQNFETPIAIGTHNSASLNGWTINTSAPNAFPQNIPGGYFEVRAGQRFEAENTNGNLGAGAINIGEVFWQTPVISLAGFATVDASVFVDNVSNNLNAGADADYVRVFYKLNGGPETIFSSNGNLIGNFADATATAAGLAGGGNIQIIVRISTNAVGEIVAFDNVLVKLPTSTISFTNPNLFNSVVSGLPQNAPGGPPIATNLTWTVSSALGVCSTSSSTMIATVNALPTALTITPQLCDDIVGLPLSAASISLSTYSASVSGAPTVDWYASAANRTAGTPKITTPVTVTNGQIFFFRATSAVGCTNDGQTTFTVNALPAAIDKSYEFCEDAVNAGLATGINLTSFEMGALGVTNGGTVVNRDVEWYEDNAGALGALIPSGALPGQESNYQLAATKTIHAKVIDLTSAVIPQCFDIADVVLTYKPKPVNNPITGDGTFCSSVSTIKVFQVNPLTNNYGTIHNYNWTINGGGVGFQVFDGVGFVSTANYTVTSSAFLLLVVFPNPGSFTITASETIDGCTGNIASFNSVVSGAPVPLVFSSPATQVCKGATQSYSLTSSNAGSQYNWTVIGGTVIGSSTTIGSATINVIWGTSTLPQPSVSVTETNVTSCTGTAVSIDVTLNDVPQMTSANNITLCSGLAPSSILPFSATIPSSTFSWKIITATANVTFVGGAAIPTFPSGGSTGTGNVNHLLFNTSGVIGTVVYEVIPTEGDLPSPPDCAGNPQTVTVTVSPEPIVNLVSNIIVCSGDPVPGVTFVANTSGGETFNWTNTNTAIGLLATGTGNIAGYTAPINFSGSDIVGSLTVTATKSGCTSAGTNLKTFTITIRPQPVVNAIANNTVCSGGSIVVPAFTANTLGGETFTWTNTNTAVGLAASGTGDIGTFTAAANLTGVNVSSIVTVTATKNGCISTGGNSKSFIITVQPAPVVAAVPNIIVCPGETIGSIAFSANTGGGEIFNWTNTNTTIGLAALGSGNIGSYVAPSNNTGANIVATIGVSGTAPTTCSGSPTTFTITIKPQPVVAAIGDISVCSGDPISAINFLANSGGGETFNWNNTNTSLGLAASGTGSIAGFVAPLNLTGVDIIGTITVTATKNACTSVGVNAKSFTITVKPQPVVNAITNISVCSGDPIATIPFSANTAGGETFNWSNNNISIGLAATGTGSIAAYTAPTNFTGVDIVATITVSATKNGCLSTGANSKSFSITVRPQPVLAVVPSISVCSGDAISAINFSANTGGAETFNWSNTNTSIGLAASGSGNIPAFVAPSNFSGVDIVGTITVTATKNGCVSVGPNSKSFTITIRPQPVVNVIANVSICSGDAVPAVIFSANTAGGETFNWTNSNPSIGLSANGTGSISSYTSPNNFTGTDIVATITVSATKNSCVSAGANAKSFTITIRPQPVVATLGNISVCSGDVVPAMVFSANTLGGETFNWVNTDAAVGIPLSGTGSISAYTAPNNFTGSEIVSTVTVSAVKNLCTSAGPNIKSFTITIKPQPVVAPIANISVCSGDLISVPAFSANSGGGESFNWSNSNTSIGIGSTGTGNISSYTAPSNFTGSDIVGTIIVTATKNGCTSSGVNSKTFSITIRPQPVVAAIANISVCSGGAISAINFSANTGGSEVFTWANSNTSIGVPANGVGGIAAYTAPTNNSGSDIVGTITVAATKNSCTSSGANSKSFFITIKAEPVVANVADIVVCSGAAISAINFSANTGGGENFNWTNTNTGIGINISGTGSIGAFTAPVNLTGVDIVGTITVAATKNACTSTGANLEIFTITVRPEPVVDAITDVSVCSGSAVPAIAFSANTLGGETFNWVNNNPGIGLGPSGTGSISSYTAPINLTGSNIVGIITVSATKNGCTSGGTNVKTFTITIRPEPVVSSVSNIVVCSGEAISAINFSANTGGGEIFNWTNTNAAIGQPLVGTGNIPGYTAPSNFTGVDILATFNVSATKNSCTSLGANAKTFTITIKPQPVVDPVASISVCSGDLVPSTTFTANTGGGEIFNWTNTNTGIGLGSSGSGTIASYTAVNNFTGSDIVGTVTVTATKNGCTSAGANAKIFTIAIKPQPVVANVTNVSVCSGEVITAISFSANTGGSEVFNWANSNTAIGLAAGGIGNIAGYTAPDNFTGSDLIGTITVTATKNGCTSAGSNGEIFTITINPEPVVATVTNKTFCPGDLVNIPLTSNVAGSAITWTNTNPLIGTALSGSGDMVFTAPANNTGSDFVGTIVVTSSKNSCVSTGANAKTFTITIKTTPVVAAVSSIVRCSGDPIPGVVFTSNADPGVTFDWTNDNPGINLAASGSGNIAGFTSSINVGSTPLIANISVRGTKNGCEGAATTFTITINPQPVLAAVVTPQICSRDANSIILGTNGSSVTAGTYQLLSRTIVPAIALDPGVNILTNSPVVATGKLVPDLGNRAPLSIGGSDLIKNDKFINTTNSTITIQYTVVGISPFPASCLGDPIVVSVDIKPEPILAPGIATVCSGLAVGPTITLAGQLGSVAPDQYDLTGVNFNGAFIAPAGTNAGLGVKPIGDNSFLVADVFTNASNITRQVTYTLVPITAGCRGPVQTVILNVDPAPALSASLNRIVCSGETNGVVMATQGSTVAADRYNYLSVLAPGLTADPANVSFPSLNNTSTSYISLDRFTNSGNAPLTVTYIIQPVSLAGCIGPSTSIVVTVEPAITMVLPTQLPLCSFSANSSSQTSFVLNSVVIPTAGNITYDYTAFSTPPSAVSGFFASQGNLPGGTTISDKLVNNTNAVATVTYLITPKAVGAKGGLGCSAPAPTTLVVSVEPQPRLSITPATQVICEGTPSTMVLSSTTTPGIGTIQFTKVSAVPTGGMTLTSTPKSTYQTGEPIGDVWDNPTITTQTVTYVFRSQIVGAGSLGCNSDDITVLLTVNPNPTIVASVQAPICSSDFVNITLTPDVANTVATYTVVAPATVSGASNGAGNLIFQTLFYNSATPTVQNSDVPVTVTYTITPKANNCTGANITVPVVVNPKPNLLRIPSRIDVCNATSPIPNLNIKLESNVVGAIYSWTLDSPPPSGVNGVVEQPVAGPASGINQVLTNTTGVQVSLTYTIKAFGPGATSCESDERIVIVTVAPEIKAEFQNPDLFICKGSSEFLIFEFSGQAPFSFVYNENNGVTSVDKTINGVGNFRVEKVTPATTTTYSIKSVRDGYNCPVNITGQSVVVSVSKQSTLSFTEVVPNFNLGSSTVTFTNTTTPLDFTQFRYEWSFGITGDANPTTFSQTTSAPIPVVYSSPGVKAVTLSVIDKVLEAASGGLICKADISKSIPIVLPPIAASFDIDPTELCFPGSIKLKNVVGTGFIHEWRVINKTTGVELLNSSLKNPIEFKVSSPGEYSVSYRTSIPSTGQVATAGPKNVVIYDLPLATFDLRPDIVYVPDTEMSTFNFSNGANQYLWDFGDGGTSDLFEPKYTYAIEGKYEVSLIAKFDHGNGVVCADTLKRTIIAKQGGQAKIPNVFTPNPNGRSSSGTGSNGTFNDVFLPLIKGVSNDSDAYNLQIYDRWGNLIFESTSSVVGWDGYNKEGKLMPAGVYVYKLTVRFSDSQRTTTVGDITMLY